MRGGNDGERFREAVKEVKEWRELGERKDRGFSWKNGALVKSLYVAWDEFRDVLVIPRSFRSKILLVAHEGSGHLGSDKVLAMLGKHFIWPGMNKEIIAHVRGCDVCQRKSKHNPRKAPVVERPLLSEPFEDIAVDIVGPLPKGKRVSVPTHLCVLSYK